MDGFYFFVKYRKMFEKVNFLKKNGDYRMFKIVY